MVISERLRNVRESAEQREFQRELARSEREEAGGYTGMARDRLQQAVKPARKEARATVQEARELSDANLRDVVAAGGSAAGSAAVSGARRAAAAVPESSGSPRVSNGMDDDTQGMFERAERTATAAPPVQASLDPVTGPENMDAFVTGVAPPPGGPGARDAGPAVDQLVTGPPAESGGMEELVMGGYRDESPMEAFVMGAAAPDDGDERGDQDDGQDVDALVPGWGGGY